MAHPHYRLIGFLRANSGLAIAAQNTLRVLQASGREVREVPIVPGAEIPSAALPTPDASEESVNLYHLNPFEIGAHASQWQAAVGTATHNVCVPFWELPQVPRDWEPMLRAMDVVLAPTQFVADACAKVVGADRVIHYPQAVFPPLPAEADRARWGLPDDATVFIASLDIGSGADRKNPWAALDAFERAFPDDDAVRLVVKTRSESPAPEHALEAQRLAARVATDARVMLLNESLSYADVLGLYASCDVMISLHRSEGLGLHLMEAMSCGTVVVATGWSGNMDFMTAENSVLVPYELVPVRTKHTTYLPEVKRAGQVWAEADISAASDLMRELHRNAEWRAAIGKRAAADMEERRRAQLSGAAFDALEASLRIPRSRPGDFDSAIEKTRSAVRRRRWHHKWLAVRRSLSRVRA